MYLAQRAGEPTSKLKIIKLMYFAEREFLKRYGAPMVYDEFFSMKDGPVCSSSLNGINGKIDQELWASFISLTGNLVAPQQTFSRDQLDELSDADIEVLESTWGAFGHMTAPQIRKYAHDNCSEYVGVESGRKPIKYKDLLTAVGRDDADEAADEINSYWQVRAFLAS